jgi:hypothetical protein
MTAARRIAAILAFDLMATRASWGEDEEGTALSTSGARQPVR